jgi:DNA-binding XRE family transcriptional regulator
MRCGMIAIGAQIKAARALLDWNRSQLAQASGLHKNAVAYWERRPDIPTDRVKVPVAVRQIEARMEDHADGSCIAEPTWRDGAMTRSTCG